MRNVIVKGIAGLALAVLSIATAEASVPKGRTCGAGRKGFFARPGLEVIGLTTDQRLVCFHELVPRSAREIGFVTGLTTDTKLVGIDYRVQDGALYGVGDAGGLYTLDPATGAVLARVQISEPLVGTSFGVDFNPAADRLRVVSDAGQNLRIVTTTGAATVDGTLAYLPPAVAPALGVAGAGYTNNDLSPDTVTTLFDLDASLDQVVLQAPPNAGTLLPTGKLKVDAGGAVGFDIYSRLRDGRTVSVRGLASLMVDGTTGLYVINLFTGEARLLGSFRDATPVVDIAVPLDQD